MRLTASVGVDVSFWMPGLSSEGIVRMDLVECFSGICISIAFVGVLFRTVLEKFLFMNFSNWV